MITTAKVTKCNFTQNQADLGGSIFIGDQKVIIEDSLFKENIATSKGGAIASLTQCKVLQPQILIFLDTKPIILSNNEFRRNNAIQGSVSASFGDIVFSYQNCKFKNNNATFGGDFFANPEQLRLIVYQVNEAFLYINDVSIQAMILSPETVRDFIALKIISP